MKKVNVPEHSPEHSPAHPSVHPPAPLPGHSGQTVPPRALADHTSAAGTGLLLFLFFLCILLPIRPVIGGITLQPYKIFLLAVLPIIMITRSPRQGWFGVPDALMLLLSVWVALTLVFHHGTSRLPLAVISAIEFFGAYLVGRILVRDFQAFHLFIRFFLWSLVVLLPFALFENRFGGSPILETLRSFVPVNPQEIQIRAGGYRAQGVFAHPIHYGLYASCLFAVLFYAYRLGLGRLRALGAVVLSVFLAQSSAPLLALGIQGIVIFWGYITRGKWRLLFGLSSTVFVALEILSNRGPVILLIETLTLNSRTAWWRIHIWNYGLENVWANPIMGLGLNEWVRPEWLAVTVDNFWLLLAMRHGLPAVLLILPVILIHSYKIIGQKGLDETQSALRRGYMISFVGLMFSLSTVHIWGQLHVFIMFFIGAGAVFYTAPTTQSNARSDIVPNPAQEQGSNLSDAVATSETGQRYTRFAKTPKTPPVPPVNSHDP